jgi:glycerophosphoryl diester phosphodiesterase
VIDLAKRKSEVQGRAIGIYPETKHPSYFRSINLPLESRLLQVLTANGYTDADAPVFIQSFEVQNLIELSKVTRLRLIQLMDDDKEQPYDFVMAGDRRTYGDLMTPGVACDDRKLRAWHRPGQAQHRAAEYRRIAAGADRSRRRCPQGGPGCSSLHLSR